MKEFPKQLMEQFKAPNLIRQLRASLRMAQPPSVKPAELVPSPAVQRATPKKNRSG
jgi:hypothetical protein